MLYEEAFMAIYSTIKRRWDDRANLDEEMLKLLNDAATESHEYTTLKGSDERRWPDESIRCVVTDATPTQTGWGEMKEGTFVATAYEEEDKKDAQVYMELLAVVHGATSGGTWSY